MRKFNILLVLLLLISTVACDKTGEDTKTKDKAAMEEPKKESKLAPRIKIYTPTEIGADIAYLTDNQKKVIEKLIEAGKLADEVFWEQTSPDAITLRDSLRKLDTPEAKEALEFVMINYGPYDLIDEGKRYLGEGPEEKPKTASFYPMGLTTEEFDKYLEGHPEDKDALLSLYTVVRKDADKYIAVPYREAFPKTQQIADKLDEAAGFADNPSLKKYLTERAKALRTDEYYDSDMAWMELKDNDIDVIIGPIESYEDGLYGQKTAYECVVVVKDKKETERLQMYKNHINHFEQKLPYDAKYIRKSVGGGHHIINIVNVLFFGGDCQAGTKTIACNLPNDPKVRSVKGGKNTMYKNMMTAKYEKIVVPIANAILNEELAKHTSPNAFMSFVILHELSHTLGRDYVYGNDKLSVREALKDRYSAIEETKADIISMYNHGHLIEMGEFTPEYAKKAMATYVAGLYRSLRFGAEEAHGKANLIQLNFLREQGAIVLGEDGKFNVNEEIFFEKCGELGKLILTIEAEGDYEKAGEVLDKYGKVTPEIQDNIDKLVNIPRDLNTTYTLAK